MVLKISSENRFVGACAMTTKFLDNHICTFQILLSWRFQRKTAFLTIFISAPNAPPPPKKKLQILFLLSSRRLWFWSTEHDQGCHFPWDQLWNLVCGFTVDFVADLIDFFWVIIWLSKESCKGQAETREQRQNREERWLFSWCSGKLFAWGSGKLFSDSVKRHLSRRHLNVLAFLRHFYMRQALFFFCHWPCD